jgi:ESCRT-I complex subunit VPS37
MGMAPRPPVMTLAGVEARHPWLDSRMCITGYVPIQSAERWAEAHVLLGVAVHAVIQHLQLNPPTIVQFVDSGLIAIQSKQPRPQQNGNAAAPGSGGHRPLSSSSASTPPPYNESMLPASSATAAPVIPEVTLPTIPHEFPELEGLTRDQLEALVMNELDFRAFCNKLPIMAEYRTIQQKLLLENAETAKQNLASESELQELVANVERMQAELREKITAFQALEKKQDAICRPPEIGKVRRELARLKREAFVKSEKIADQWLETLEMSSSAGNGSTEAFCDEFIAARKVHHLRAAKLELLERNNVQNFANI